MSALSVLQLLAVAAVTLGVLIAFHEYGHFWVARRCGVHVERFSIGFGPPLWSRRDRYGTEFVLAAIPLGGYVKMLGEEGGEPVALADREKAFNHKPVRQRMAIVAAGPLANILLAVVVLWGVHLGGVSGLVPVVDTVTPGSLADMASLEPGQEIVAVDGDPTPTWRALQWRLLSRIGESGTLRFSVTYPGSDLVYESEAPLRNWLGDAETPDPLEGAGLTLRVPEPALVVGQVLPDSPAARAGFQAGDRLRRVGDVALGSWQQWVALVRAHPDEPLTVTIERGGQSRTVTVTPEPRTETTEDGAAETVGKIGMGGTLPEDAFRVYRYSWLGAWSPAVKETWKYGALTLESLKKMVLGQLSPRNLSGPVTIARVASSSAEAGWQSYLSFLALLSMTLAVLNLLPIPVLDGGHLLFYGIEALLGKPVPDRIQMMAYRVGLSIIIGVTVLALVNDFSRL